MFYYFSKLWQPPTRLPQDIFFRGNVKKKKKKFNHYFHPHLFCFLVVFTVAQVVTFTFVLIMQRNILEVRTEKNTIILPTSDNNHMAISFFSYNLSFHLKAWHSCSQEMIPCEIKRGLYQILMQRNTLP